MKTKVKNYKKRIKYYIFNREKSGTRWKLGTSIITLSLLVFLYSRGIIAIATIDNQPVTINELIQFLTRDGDENIIDSAIAEKVIELEARKRNIVVTQQETQAELNRLARQAAQNGKTIYELLQTSEEDSIQLEKNVKLRITLYKILSSGMPITEDEIERHIELNTELYKPEEKDIIERELKMILLDEKISQDFDSWIRDANAETDVDYLVDLDNI